MDAVWRRSVDRLRNRVGEAASVAGTLRVLEQELRSRLADAPSRGLDLVQRTGARLAAAHGAVPVGALTGAAGVSANHLAAQFKAHVGVTPKRVARIYRFARLILSVDAPRPVQGLPRVSGVRPSDVGDHVVVVSHRPKPEGWHPEASYHFVDDVTAAIDRAQQLDQQHLLEDPHVVIQGERVLHLRFKVRR